MLIEPQWIVLGGVAALFEPFRSGHSRTWGYTLTGAVSGRPFTAFEYRWVTGGGKSSHRHAIRAPAASPNPTSWSSS